MNEARVLASLAKTVNKQKSLLVEVKSAKTVNKLTKNAASSIFIPIVCIVLCVCDVHLCHPPTPPSRPPFIDLNYYFLLSLTINSPLIISYYPYIYIYILRIGGNITQGTTQREVSNSMDPKEEANKENR